MGFDNAAMCRGVPRECDVLGFRDEGGVDDNGHRPMSTVPPPRSRSRIRAWWLALALVLGACTQDMDPYADPDAAVSVDAGAAGDASISDGGQLADAPPFEDALPMPDAGVCDRDAGYDDGGTCDEGDAGPTDDGGILTMDGGGAPR